jgi:hypothetical protein
VNFFLEDVFESVLAGCLFPIFLLVPGYLLAASLDIWQFRSRSVGARLALGIVISFAVTPGVAYLLARFWSLQLVCYVFLTVSLLCLLMRTAKSRSLNATSALSAVRSDRHVPQAVALAAVWMGAAIFLLSDFQSANRLYPNVVAHDYAWRIAVTGAITRTDVPPINPDFYPGHPVQLYYYYFWFMTCSLVDLLGGSWVGPRGALFAGAGWIGVGLMATVGLYVRLIAPEHSMVRTRSIFLALALLLVTGFDIVPIAGTYLYQLTQGPLILYPSAEWWNEAVGAWPHSVMWVPHHMAALIATLGVFLVFSNLPYAATGGARVTMLVTCSLGLFSALGMSVWITFAFAIFWIAWIVMTSIRGWHAEARAGMAIALLASILSIPYLFDLYRANFTHVLPLVFAMRPFSPIHAWMQGLHAGMRRLFVADLVSLPLNYFLEFGFFALAATVYWRRRWQIKARLGRNELALLTLAASALVIASILRSNIVNNDLGYRSILFTQFVLLLWSSDVLQVLVSRQKGEHTGLPIGQGMATLLLVSLVIGTLPHVYEAGIMKMYAMAGDLHLSARRVWPFLGEDNLGRRYYDFREAYRWIHRHFPESAIVQHNPDIYMDVPSGLYANRQAVASDRYYGPQFGIRPDMYEPVFSAISEIFSPQTDSKHISCICRQFGIAALIVKDTDPIWSHRESWVFQETPVFANQSSRVFDCAAFRLSTHAAVEDLRPRSTELPTE